MNDPLVVEKGLGHMAVDMFNTANAKAMAEFNKASIEIPATAFDFNAFVDGAAALAFEGEDVPVFALCHKNGIGNSCHGRMLTVGEYRNTCSSSVGKLRGTDSSR